MPVPIDISWVSPLGNPNARELIQQGNGVFYRILDDPGGSQEAFFLDIPENIAIDRLVFYDVGKRDTNKSLLSGNQQNNNSNVTLGYAGFAVSRSEIGLVKGSTLNLGADSELNAGDTITYTFTATNLGRVVLNNVQLSETSFSGENALPTPTTTDNINGVDPGETVVWTSTYTLAPEDLAAGGVTNEAAVAAQPGINGPLVTDDSDSSNPADGDGVGTPGPDDDTPTTTALPNANLVTVKTVSQTTAVPGDTVTFEIEVTNEGPDDATNVTLTDQLPDGVDLVAPVAGYNATTGVWTVGNLAANATATLTLTTTVASDTEGSTTENVTTAATGDQPDPTTDGDDLSASFDVPDGPVAVADEDLDNVPGPVTVPVLGNDTAGDAPLDDETVTLVGADGDGNIVATGQGTWSVEADGQITFTPLATFEGDPTPVSYTVADENGLVSDPVTVTVTYRDRPVAENDSEGPLPRGTEAELNIVLNDTPGDDPLDPSTVVLTSLDATDSNGDGRADRLEVDGEGVWTVDPVTGITTFVPDEGLLVDPTPIEYNVADTTGLRSNDALITVTYNPADASILVDKRLVEPFAQEVGDIAIFQVEATNTGNVILTDLDIEDTMTDLAGASAPPDTVERTDTFDILRPGEIATWTVTRALRQSDFDAGGLENTARVFTNNPPASGGPGPVEDISDDTDDTDGNTVDDPTVLLLQRRSEMTLVKVAADASQSGTTAFEQPFTLVVENTGNVTETGLTLADDLAAFAAPSRIVSVSTPIADGFGGTGGVNTGFDGVTDTNLLSGPVTLAPGESGMVTFTVTLDVVNGEPARPNLALLSSDLVTVPLEGFVTTDLPEPALPTLLAEKSVAPGEALLGSTVRWTLSYTATTPVPAVGVTITDELPAGLAYTPGSTTLDGVAFRDPRITGNQLAWDGVDIDDTRPVVIAFDTRVGEGPNERVNQTVALSSTGLTSSNIATATLRIRREAVFSCGDIIGKVFDDRNLDGLQDNPEDDPRVSDQTFGGGKLARSPDRIEGEPGLAGIRLATPTGLVVTTDEYGRYSIPCAALPRQSGSNFTLKLDERTLPTGYEVTTENPRTLRITAAKINFGAALANIVGIDLTDEAFAGTTPVDALQDGLKGLRAQMEDAPVLLRITYLNRGEDSATINARLDAVERLASDIWRGGRVSVERRVAR